MTIRKSFLRRPESDLRKSDEEIMHLVLADNPRELFEQWSRWGGCHLFMVQDVLYARGNKEERDFARGFVFGWRNALRHCQETEE